MRSLKLRLWLLRKLFPYNHRAAIANRVEWSYKTPAMTISVCVKDNAQPGALTREEIIEALNLFVGRKITEKEFATVLVWQIKTNSQEAA